MRLLMAVALIAAHRRLRIGEKRRPKAAGPSTMRSPCLDLDHSLWVFPAASAGGAPQMCSWGRPTPQARYKDRSRGSINTEWRRLFWCGACRRTFARAEGSCKVNRDSIKSRRPSPGAGIRSVRPRY